jgi:predicted TIM-barrel fold metal-dependent hydrolase
MKMDDMILISVDDHLVEPPDAFTRHMPAKFKDRAPKVVKGDQGEDTWLIEDLELPNIALNAVVGRPYEEYGMEPTSFDQLRPGTYELKGRIDDMNVNGVLAGLNFPSVPGVGGQSLEGVKDKKLAYAIMQAWNDWHLDEWCAVEPARFIPLAIISTWDPEGAAKEIKRVAQKGCHAISFPPNPAGTGGPSIHNPVWEPVWKACIENDVNICMHISDASSGTPSMDSPVDVMITNMPVSLYSIASDLTYSPILRKYPELRFSLSEGGVGWIPHFYERVDYVHERHIWTNQDFRGRQPSSYFKDQVFTCFIDDPHGVKSRAEVGVEKMMWECDYPHSDTTWPKSPEVLWRSLEDVPDAEINAITHENAMRAYNFEPFKHKPKAECTVAALRAQATHVDTTVKHIGRGTPPAQHNNVVTVKDVHEQLTKMHRAERK